jgi:hypothetical protein
LEAEFQEEDVVVVVVVVVENGSCSWCMCVCYNTVGYVTIVFSDAET